MKKILIIILFLIANPVFAFDSDKIINLINLERKKEGLSQLDTSNKLTNGAKYKTLDMYKYEYFKHGYPHLNDESILRAFTIAGYRGFRNGEILSRGYSSEDEVVEGWMNSKLHKDVILTYDYEDIGCYEYGSYTTCLFGKKIDIGRYIEDQREDDLEVLKDFRRYYMYKYLNPYFVNSFN